VLSSLLALCAKLARLEDVRAVCRLHGASVGADRADVE
jgi:hypothetical protein